jgi:eukaryotic-like serine/threonine-protein kinase
LLSLKPGVTAAELPSTPFLEREGRISPSGRSLAFASFASGRSEIYVGSLSTPSTAQPISLNGGTNPRWSASGRELIYMVTATDLMRVTVRETATGIEVSEPELLMRSPHAIGDYDVTPDGANIVIRTIEEQTTPPIQLVINAPHPM